MKRLTHIAGGILAITAGAYFLYYAHRSLQGHDLAVLLQPRLLLALAALTLLYTTLVPITATAWSWLLAGLGERIGVSRTIPILATSQFGKYLPGNVAQHLGRIAFARKAGVSMGPLLLSMAFETLLVLVACCHISLATLLAAPPALLARWPLGSLRLPGLVVISIVAIVIVWMAPKVASPMARWRARRRGETEDEQPLSRTHPGWSAILASYLAYMTNFLIVGFGIWVVALTVNPSATHAVGIAFLVGAFASSWVLGFLAPGAPAGLGIREALLSIWLTGSFAANEVVLLIIALRIATTVGDLLNFAWGSIALSRGRAVAP